jgi:hypothetical protein
MALRLLQDCLENTYWAQSLLQTEKQALSSIPASVLRSMAAAAAAQIRETRAQLRTAIKLQISGEITAQKQLRAQLKTQVANCTKVIKNLSKNR